MTSLTKSAAGDQTSTDRPLTGRHVLAIAIGAFLVILTANMAMVLAATGSFPGLVEKNSYVASQDFNRRAELQSALGWTATMDYAKPSIGVSIVGVDGAPVRGLAVEAVVGRPSDASNDQRFELVDLGETYAAQAILPSGLWRIEIVAHDPDAPQDRMEAVARFFVD